MSKRSKLWAVRARWDLVLTLGGRCANCGTKGTPKNGLELDHIKPGRWEAHTIGSDQRIKVYRSELKKGNLQVLCKSCNIEKGDRE